MRTERLTPRELQVLSMLASGCSYCQAAIRLGISPHTVVTHVKNAYRKLDVHTAAAAVMRAVELGVLPTPTMKAYRELGVHSAGAAVMRAAKLGVID